MQYRTQTYLGALQFLAIIAGLLVLGAMVKSADALIIEHPKGYRYVVWLAHWGGLLLFLPAMWIKLTIQAEQSDLRWATKRITFISGLVLLGTLSALFAYAVFLTIFAPSPRSVPSLRLIELSSPPRRSALPFSRTFDSSRAPALTSSAVPAIFPAWTR